MKRILNQVSIVTVLLLFAAALLISLSQNSGLVEAQADVAVVTLLPSSGGTTSPEPGTYTYANGTNIVLSATPSAGYEFQYWIVVGGPTPGHTATQIGSFVDPETGEVIPIFPTPSQAAIDSTVFTANPATITCGYGYTYNYQAIFYEVSTEPSPQPTSSPGTQEAVVIIMPTAGGTVSPAAGMYTYPNGATFQISATPNSGYEFSYWLVSGNFTPGHTTGGYSIIVDPETGEIVGQVPRPEAIALDTLVFSVNPANITCGYGYTYTYTAVFGEATTPTPTPTPTQQQTPTPTVQPTPTPSPVITPTPTPDAGTDMTLLIVGIVVVVIIILIVIAAIVMRRK